MKLYREFTDLVVLGKRPSIKGKTIREAQKTCRITRGDEFLEIGTYLRVHVHPKRFPRYQLCNHMSIPYHLYFVVTKRSKVIVLCLMWSGVMKLIGDLELLL